MLTIETRKEKTVISRESLIAVGTAAPSGRSLVYVQRSFDGGIIRISNILRLCYLHVAVTAHGGESPTAIDTHTGTAGLIRPPRSHVNTVEVADCHQLRGAHGVKGLWRSGRSRQMPLPSTMGDITSWLDTTEHAGCALEAGRGHK